MASSSNASQSLPRRAPASGCSSRPALRSLKKAAELEPDNPEPYYELGFLYKDGGKSKDARKALSGTRELAFAERGWSESLLEAKSKRTAIFVTEPEF